MSHAELEAVHNNLSHDASPETVRLLATIDLLTAECAAWRRAEHLRRNEPHMEFVRLAKARAAVTAARILPEPTP